ncbi:MAG: PASTA domain-containing protein [Desulfobacteraceae bacterium]|nr:PASTA domain-containing protein [Desulfobacteraceae bacterium]
MIRVLIKYAAIVVIFCIIAGLSAFFTLSFVIKSQDTVTVPELEGKNVVKALELLSELGLNTKVSGSEYSDMVSKNQIIRQDPAAGEVIKKNRDVTLVVSKGPETVAVPDLKGRKPGRAELVVEENGLELGHITRTRFSGAEKDSVIAQYPQAGKTVKRNIPVNLLVSTGPVQKFFKMPDLSGSFLDEAMLVIDSHQMKLEEIKSVHNPEKPENMVTGQAPPAGYRVSEDEQVRLMVNRRPGGKSGADDAEKRVLFSYRLPAGFLKQHVRLEMNCFGTRLTIYDKLMEPDTLIWAVVPKHSRGAVFLYVNDELVKSEIFD